MPRISKGPHTPQSLRHTAENLKQIATQIEVAAVLMETIPEVPSVVINYEQGRTDGLAWLQQWADGARDAVRVAKLERLRSVSPGNPPVSPAPAKSAKPKQK